jgi:hypothetical protein
LEPFDDVLFEPRNVFAYERDLKNGMPRDQIGFVGEDNAFELEVEHTAVRVVGDEEAAMGVMQVVRVVGTVLFDGVFDPIPFGG